MVIKLIEKNDVVFSGDFDGSVWIQIPTIVPGGIGNSIQVDFGQEGQVAFDPPLRTSMVLAENFSYSKNNYLIIEGYFLGGDQIGGPTVKKGYTSINCFSDQAFNNAGFMAWSCRPTNKNSFSVNGLSQDLQDKMGWLWGWQYNTELPKIRFMFKHETNGFRKMLHFFDEYVQEWAIALDILCADSSPFYVEPSITEKIFIELVSASDTAGPSFFQYQMDSIEIKTTEEPVMPVNYASEGYFLHDFTTNNWQDYFNLNLANSAVDPIEWQNKVNGNITTEPGGHFFDSTIPRLTMDCELNYNELYYFNSMRFYDNPNKRNYRVTMPLFFSAEFFVELYLQPDVFTFDQTAYLFFDGANISIDFYGGAFVSVPNVIAATPNTWYYLQMEVLQGETENTVSIGVGEEIASYDPSGFVRPAQLQNIVNPINDTKVPLTCSFYCGGDGPTFKTTGILVETF